MRRVERRQPPGQRLGHPRHPLGVHVEVRVAHRVDVALRAIGRLAGLDQIDLGRPLEVARLAGQDPRIGARPGAPPAASRPRARHRPPPGGRRGEAPPSCSASPAGSARRGRAATRTVMFTASPPTVRASMPMLDVVATTLTAAARGTAARAGGRREHATSVSIHRLPPRSEPVGAVHAEADLELHVHLVVRSPARRRPRQSPRVYWTRNRENSVGLKVSVAPTAARGLEVCACCRRRRTGSVRPTTSTRRPSVHRDANAVDRLRVDTVLGRLARSRRPAAHRPGHEVEVLRPAQVLALEREVALARTAVGESYFHTRSRPRKHVP